jgi:hypothetical protein
MQRELRYIVLKNIDVQRALTNCEYAILIELCQKIKAHRLDRGAGPLCCVVVEHDWPEYEPTWAAIEARVDAEIAANKKAAGFDA